MIDYIINDRAYLKKTQISGEHYSHAASETLPLFQAQQQIIAPIFQQRLMKSGIQSNCVCCRFISQDNILSMIQQHTYIYIYIYILCIIIDTFISCFQSGLPPLLGIIFYYETPNTYITIPSNYSMKPSKPIFTLQIKVMGKLLDVPVTAADDKHSISRTLCDTHGIPLQQRELIQEKITASLTNIIKKDSVAPALLDKVLGFFHRSSTSQSLVLEQEIQNDRDMLRQKSRTSIMREVSVRQQQSHAEQSKSIQLPELRLLERDTIKTNLGKTVRKNIENEPPKETRDYPSYQDIKARNIVNKEPTPEPVDITPRLGHSNKNLNPKRTVRERNEDELLTAYQSVFKKSKDPTVKNKAKQIIQQFRPTISQGPGSTDRQALSNRYINIPVLSNSNSKSRNVHQSRQPSRSGSTERIRPAHYAYTSSVQEPSSFYSRTLNSHCDSRAPGRIAHMADTSTLLTRGCSSMERIRSLNTTVNMNRSQLDCTLSSNAGRDWSNLNFRYDAGEYPYNPSRSHSKTRGTSIPKKYCYLES